jgi:hypothetical protein
MKLLPWQLTGRLEKGHKFSMLTATKQFAQKTTDFMKWDQIGLALSVICALHCMLLPFVILSLPILARYFLANPFFHVLLALLILPVGTYAFLAGFRHHRNLWVLFLGFPGMLLVVVTPYLVHALSLALPEAAILFFGSGLLIAAHIINRKSCQSCQNHQHEHNHDDEVHSH